MARSHAALVVVVLVAVGLVAFPGAATAVGSGCATDPQGDAFDTEDADVVDPLVDLVETCVDWTTGQLSFSTRVVQPTDPNAEPRWLGISEAAWFVETTGDDIAEFRIVFGLNQGNTALVSIVFQRADVEGGDELQRCEGTPLFDGTTFGAEIDPACIDNPASARFYARVMIDTDTDPANISLLHLDFAPDAGFIGPLEPLQLRPTERLFGGNRFETAVAVSQRQFAGGAAAAYLARADDPADAVAAGVLTDGPILLVSPCGELPAVVATELERLQPERVVALGAESAVCQALLDAAATGRTAGRLAGPSRIDTAAAIARSAFPDAAEDVYLARADVVVDALSGGALTTGPILLVPQCGEVPAAVREELDRLSPARVTALGGTGAVCAELLLAAADGRGNRDAEPNRLSGDSRYTTGVAISQAQFPAGPLAEVFLARGDEPADAVAAGSLTGAPVLLIPACGPLPGAVAQEIARLNPQTLVALGGPAAICDDQLEAAATR